ncbi:MAG: hypothetical protein F6K09_34325, partial [Merismopedia sp. SIO2A8]|nr:hypothetical protein [Merismopedia sp. SIO2A8]
MPRATYGSQVKNRAMRLFEALVAFAQDIVNEDNSDIEFSWQGKNSTHPELVIKTQTRFLIELTKKDQYEGTLSKAQVVEALQRMADFLGILDDHRLKKKGSEERHFTLKLYSQDLATNLEKFNQEWEDKRSGKSKERELVSTTTNKKSPAIRPKPGIPFQAPPLPPQCRRAEALGKLAPKLPEILLPEALKVARAITHQFSRAIALRELVPHVPEILPEALEAAQVITDEFRRAIALRELALHMAELIPEALEAAREINNEYKRALVLRKLAPHVPEILPEALEVARAITDEEYRAWALIELALHLPDILPEVLEAARAIK